MSYSIEKQIEEWLAQQASEDLPGKGKPLDLDGYFRCPEDLRIGYSLLKNAGYVPEEVEQLQQIARLVDELDKCADPAARSRLRSHLDETRVRLNLTLEAARRRRRG
jgi:DnaJ-like protein